MSLTYPCVSPTLDGIRDDQRVNYAFGMVLGVDEMVQEQRHRLVADAAGYALLAGSGTLDGLAVTATELVGEAAGEVQITVAPGTGVDRLGRRFVVPQAQCARLGAWVAAQERARPGTIADQPRDDDGTIRVYVVAQYASCLDALVPLPGQPCSSSEAGAVPSRITDAWDVDLRWIPPANPRWDADRALASLLGVVEVVPDLAEPDVREAELVAAIDAIGADPDMPPPDTAPSGEPFRLPAAELTPALDRLLTHWVTVVRPRLEPNLERPGIAVDAAVLLAQLAFDPGEAFDPDQPRIASFRPPNETGRPYLLHTQLVQRLRDLHSPPSETARPPWLPVTLAYRRAADADGDHLLAWWHLDAPVSLREEVTVVDESGAERSYRPSARDAAGAPTDLSRVWRLDPPPDTGAIDGQQLQVTFPGSTPVGVDGMTLADAAQVMRRTFVGATENGDIVASVVVDLDSDQQPQPPPWAVDFVTVTPEGDPQEVVQMELWFHLTPWGRTEHAMVTKPAIEVFDETSGARLAIQMLEQDQNYRNLWHLRVDRLDSVLPAAYLRLVWHAEDFQIDSDDGAMALATWIEKRQMTFVGWAAAERLVVSYARIPRKVLA